MQSKDDKRMGKAAKQIELYKLVNNGLSNLNNQLDWDLLDESKI